MIRIGMATSHKFSTLTASERALIPLLNRLGIQAEPVIWEDENCDFSKFDHIVIRSCWDYHVKVEAFSHWLAQLNKAGIPLSNPYPVLLSNINKSYLKTLQTGGVNIVPTEWIPTVNSREILRVLQRNQWHKAVLKPTVSASALHTYLISQDTPIPALNGFENAEFMLQPFLPEVTATGEWSLIFFNKAFSHAILKKPKPGDFRVQQELGGTSVLVRADDDIINQARDILSFYKEPLLYARVDGIIKDGNFQLMELELIEPELFLFTEALRNNFANAIKEFVTD